MTGSQTITRVLSVAGSDSGGGAGIQADLKAFARCGVHGMSAVTVVSAQNTRGVELIHAVPPRVIVAQIEAVIGDLGVDAVKVGMIGGREAVIAVGLALGRLAGGVPIVVDPVLVASTGARLLDPDALDVFCELILPLASVLTPNLPEARTLVDHSTGNMRRAVLGRGRASRGGARTGELGGGGADSPSEADLGGGGGDSPGETDLAVGLVEALGRLGPKYIVLTGGHRTVASDLYWDGETAVEIPGERHPGGATHGSGCTHSAVLAAELGRGRSVLEAARTARRMTGEAVARGLAGLGGGEGPVDVLGLAGSRISGRRDRLP